MQCNASFNAQCGTLRGLHYQAAPARRGQARALRARGDLRRGGRPARRTRRRYCRWHGVELSADNRLALYLPAGLAHGFQTLTDDCEVLYQMGHAYVPEAARGVRWDDPAFAIEWPAPPAGGRIISERDQSYEDFWA